MAANEDDLTDSTTTPAQPAAMPQAESTADLEMAQLLQDATPIHDDPSAGDMYTEK